MPRQDREGLIVNLFLIAIAALFLGGWCSWLSGGFCAEFATMMLAGGLLAVSCCHRWSVG